MVGTKRKYDGGIGEEGRDIVKKEKAINLLERIKMYKELASASREAGADFGGSAATWWKHGN